MHTILFPVRDDFLILQDIFAIKQKSLYNIHGHDSTIILIFSVAKMKLRNVIASNAPPRVTEKKLPMSSAERTRKFREKKKEKPGYSEPEEREAMRKRVKEIREKQRLVKQEKCTRICKDPSCTLHTERDRKQKYRDMQNKDEISKEEVAAKKRRKHNKEKNMDM